MFLEEFYKFEEQPSDIKKSMAFDILEELGGKKYFKKFKNIKHLNLLEELVIIACKEETNHLELKDQDGVLMETVYLKTINFFMVAFYLEAIRLKLKGKKILDYVNSKCRHFVDKLRLYAKQEALI